MARWFRHAAAFSAGLVLVEYDGDLKRHHFLNGQIDEHRRWGLKFGLWDQMPGSWEEMEEGPAQKFLLEMRKQYDNVSWQKIADAYLDGFFMGVITMAKQKGANA